MISYPVFGYNLLYSYYSYAIGGLAGGEDKDSFWRVVAQCTAALPEDKPRYVMVQRILLLRISFYLLYLNSLRCDILAPYSQGVGYPLDIVVCSALGADMYDCVYPTRTARFGTALVPEVLYSPLSHIHIYIYRCI